MKTVFLLIAVAVAVVMGHSLKDKSHIDLKTLLVKFEDDGTPSDPDFGAHDEEGSNVDIDAPEDDAKSSFSRKRYSRQLHVRLCT